MLDKEKKTRKHDVGGKHLKFCFAVEFGEMANDPIIELPLFSHPFLQMLIVNKKRKR